MTPSENHNALAREFVVKVAADTSSASEMLVVIESSILAAMLILSRVYGLSPAGAVEMIETSIGQATERFTKEAG